MNANPKRVSRRPARGIRLSSWTLIATLLLAGCGPSSQPLTGSGVEASSSTPRAEAPTLPEGDLSDLVAGNTAFAADLYHAIPGQDGNLIFSPFSVSLTMAMVYAGAHNQTEDQMAETLRYTLPQERLHPAFNALDQILVDLAEGDPDKDSTLELRIANAIWAQTNYPFLRAFLDTLATNYGAGLRLLDFAQAPDPSRATINNWVADQTDQHIQNLLAPGVIDDTTRLVLTNAIYFKAPWANPFDKKRTIDGPFTLLDGSTVTAPMMSNMAEFGYVSGDGYQAVELLHDAGTTSMVILLPAAGRFEEFQAGLTGARLDEIVASLQRQKVDLTMPRFTFDSPGISLADTLAAMGMPAAFSPGQADFSGMDGSHSLFLSAVVHKAFIAVDEEGSEAAAATAAVVGVTSMQPQPARVAVDRPFVFLIRDLKTGTVLFLGQVLDPTA